MDPGDSGLTSRGTFTVRIDKSVSLTVLLLFSSYAKKKERSHHGQRRATLAKNVNRKIVLMPQWKGFI